MFFRHKIFKLFQAELQLNFKRNITQKPANQKANQFSRPFRLKKCGIPVCAAHCPNNMGPAGIRRRNFIGNRGPAYAFHFPSSCFRRSSVLWALVFPPIALHKNTFNSAQIPPKSAFSLKTFPFHRRSFAFPMLAF
jgi:hypothetical protein